MLERSTDWLPPDVPSIGSEPHNPGLCPPTIEPTTLQSPDDAPTTGPRQAGLMPQGPPPSFHRNTELGLQA